MKIFGFLIVYQCVDDGEQEACFYEPNKTVAEHYIKTALPPEGFENRPGFYFIEKVARL